MKKKYGILAYPAGHSLSPVMHNAAFKALKINAIYSAYEIPEENLADFMKVVRKDFGGLSVSLPYKEVIMNYLDDIDEDAKKIGAVNTVVNRNGILIGYNTDFLGSNRALTEAMPNLKGKTAVILGAGGAARAIAYGLLNIDANVLIKNRTKAKADGIAIDFAEMFKAEIHSANWDSLKTGDILINTSSFWLDNKDIEEKDLPSFCDKSFVKKFQLVMDIGYNSHLKHFRNPLMTPLLIRAKECVVKVVTGEKMLLYQAVEQFKLWTDKEAPVEVMRRTLEKNL